MDAHRDWALEEFGDLDVRDRRLRRRLVTLTGTLAKNPNGTVASVYKSGAERQAAYDLLSNAAVPPAAVLASVSNATARRCRGSEFVFVPVDGTSITLADQSKTKPLGSVGAKEFPTRGLLAVDALAVAPNGTTLGLLGVKFWARKSSRRRLSRSVRRRLGITEMRHWNRVMVDVTSVLQEQAPSVRPWFVMDREADEARILRDASQATFTIRAAQNRVVEHRGRATKLHAAIRSTKPVARCTINVPSTPKRKGRIATVEIRATTVTIVLPKYAGPKPSRRLEVNVVEVSELGRRTERLHWVLLTNAPIDGLGAIDEVVRSYKTRWRIEEFHRTWKSGSCGLEDIQLRTLDGIRKWAIMLATVAARTERLKLLARTEPDSPATLELEQDEIAALILAKRQIKNSVETVPDGVPTIAIAVRWIAQLGGWAAQYKKGAQPGAVTIGRGLYELAIWTHAYRTARQDAEAEKKMR
jgi:hypothetical protein